MRRHVKLVILGFLTLISVGLVLMLKRVPQDQAYHLFADSRLLWRIPNFANVISNFFVVGVKGMSLLRRSSVPQGMRWTYGVLFAGIFLTGLGSAYYHWQPDNDRLVWDRVPMALVFMGCSRRRSAN